MILPLAEQKTALKLITTAHAQIQVIMSMEFKAAVTDRPMWKKKYTQANRAGMIKAEQCVQKKCPMLHIPHYDFLKFPVKNGELRSGGGRGGSKEKKKRYIK